MTTVLAKDPSTQSGKAFALLNQGILLISVLSLIFPMIHYFRASPRLKIKRATKAKIVLPAYALSAFLSALLLIFFSYEESYWVKKDQMMMLSDGGFSSYEDEISKQLIHEVRELIE